MVIMKELLLTKSNLRKSRGISIGISLLILFLSLLLSAALIIVFDFLPDVDKQRERLNAGDTTVLVTNNKIDLDEAYFRNTLKDDINDLSYTKGLGIQYEVKYGSGSVTPFVFIASYDRVKENKIGKTEIIDEDTSITSNYIYLAYQFYSGGGFKIGDDFTIKMPGKDYTYKVRGFVNNYNLGTYNNSLLIVLLDNQSLESLEGLYQDNKTISVDYILNEGVNAYKFTTRLTKEIYKTVRCQVLSTTSDNTASNRTFTSTIFIVSLFVTAAILAFVVILMISNVISNYIKQNMKNIGALKAMGYTSSTIKLALILQFGILTLVGALLGSGLVYLLMQLIATALVSQYGMPYSVSFSFPAFIICIVSVLVLIFLLVLLFTRKINKIEPIVALKDGVENHNFKRNVIPFSKSRFGLNVTLALKSLFNNIRQHITTFIVVFLLTFGGVIAFVMLENFGVNINLSMLTFETANGVVSCDKETKDELYQYLNSRDDVSSCKFLVSISVIDGNDVELTTYIIDDINKLNNKEVCYSGRLPIYDNEIAVSGKYAKEEGYSVGDSVVLCYGNKTYSYLITGFIQSTNNGGHESVIEVKAFNRICDTATFPGYYWFNTNNTQEVFNDIKAKFGDHITSTMDFDATVVGSLQVFKGIAWGMMFMVLGLTIGVIVLVLYLLMKTMIYEKRFDYGILKSLGYTSKDLMIQNALSFMPAIILGTILSLIVSSILANPYLTLIMSIFGIMKGTFTIPVLSIIIMGICQIAISFGIAYLLSGRIKKVEPYKLLIAE